MRFTNEQVLQLLKPIAPQRVGNDGKGHAAVPQQDIRAHLTRVFGFGGWDTTILTSELVFETPRTGDDGQVRPTTGWDVCYRVSMRLTVKDQDGNPVATYEDSAADTAENQKRGAAHGLALRSAVSLALKRCAINLGDQFGLGLYNKGSLHPIVMGLVVGMPDYSDAADLQASVPQSEPDESMGGEDPDTPAKTSVEPQNRPVERPAPPDSTEAPPEPSRRPVDVPADSQQGHAPPLAQAQARHRNAMRALHPDWSESERRTATSSILSKFKGPDGWPVIISTATSDNWNRAAAYWEDELAKNQALTRENGEDR